MSTQARIIANQRNAQKSTGPRSCQGKSIVSQNAVKHGLTADHDIISQECQADFDLYRDQFLAELAPNSPMESMLAERIVNLSWRLKRLYKIQNQTIDALSTPDTSGPLAKLLSKYRLPTQPDPSDSEQACPERSRRDLTLGRLAVKDFSNNRVLERLLMYERRIENSLYKTYLEFQRLKLIKNLNPGPNVERSEIPACAGAERSEIPACAGAERSEAERSEVPTPRGPGAPGNYFLCKTNPNLTFTNKG